MSVIMISRDGRSEEEWRELRLALAKAIEARRAETVKQGSVEDESAVPKGFAQGEDK